MKKENQSEAEMLKHIHELEMQNKELTLAKEQADKILQDLFDKNPMSIQIIDEEGFTLKVNPAHTSLFGSVPPPGFSIFTDLLNKQPALEKFFLLARNGEIVHLPDIYYNVNDSIPGLPDVPVWISAVIFPLNNDEGKPKQFIIMHENITKRKKVEETLRASEKISSSLYSMFRLIADNTNDLLWAKDINKKFIFVNKAICEKLLIANSIDEPIGKTDLFFANREREAHPENPDWHTFGEICADSDAITLNERKLKQFDEFGNIQGKFLFLDVHKAPIWDERGTLIGVVGTARDITLTKKIENEKSVALELLRISEAKHRLLIENSHDIIYTLTLNGVFMFVSPAWTVLLGHQLTQVVGHQINQFVHPDDLPGYLAFIRKVFETEQRQDGVEYRVQHIDGSWHWHTTSAVPLRDKTGMVIGYEGIASDFTKRKRAEEKVKKKMDELQKFHNLTIDRELTMIELKKEVNELLKKCGLKEKYRFVG